MPSCKKYLSSIVLATILFGCSAQTQNLDIKTKEKKDYITVKHKEYVLEDQYIIYALENESQRKFNISRDIYYKLFLKTNKYEYLVKFLSLNFLLNDLKTIKKYASENLTSGIKEEEQILRFYILSLFKLKEYDNSIVYAKQLVDKFYKDVNLELLGTIYLQKKDYKKASETFLKAYKLTQNSRTLFSLSNVKYYYLDEKEEAISLLENFIDKNGLVYSVAIQLLTLYEKDKSDDKIIALLKEMYFKYNDNQDEELLKRIKSLLLRYLAKKDINEALEFFEKNDKDPEILLALYRNSNQPLKALDILNKLYKKTNNSDYLAQIAILEFELADNKKDVLASVIRKFAKALETLDNPIYQNYLAYILIDYDKDVEKGLVLVKQALEKEPDNLAYIDTLAWGEYKLNNCTTAYEQMKKVVDKAGLEDDEIKFHWEKIKECIK
ncbi:tetratricopeptide repeat protein [Arcobacter roscoffensis]|uniref:Tetratricopeptide repeat protein n=1 Tax=Arcobacter roscoffensis TaxID=2961520 RepID=A0ABY5E094_9BACT|nr:hypothetical protein [Arcobacter roscoffensis]UTJ05629.1 hypothetical protein NJU99_10165 [Arcobacter roscoffensis]